MSDESAIPKVGGDYLAYPWRRRGMDHDRYDWSIMPQRAPRAWPNGAPLAVWIVAPLTWYPLNLAPRARPVPGSFEAAYPNIRDYTHRDYGNRVGGFRLMETLDRFTIRATSPVNAAVCTRYPALVKAGLHCGWEFAGHGLHMGLPHSSDLGEDEEARMIAEALDIVRGATGQPVIGWLSPGNSESPRTLDLLAAAGVEYVCDWVNDELPYQLRTKTGRLSAMPYAHHLNDATIIWQSHHSASEFADQAITEFDYLYDESHRQGCRVFALTVHSWCIGQPHRIGALRRILDHIASHDGLWFATGSEMLAAYQSVVEG